MLRRSSAVSLRVIGLNASFTIKQGKEFESVKEDIDISSLSTEIAGGFVGCTVGVFAQDSNSDRETPVYANFRQFDYVSLVPKKVN